MKITELYEDGVIVPGVNTTPDVKPGETERQAKKLFPMNKNGKPKSMGVKGATPNQAFNLGLTENMSVTGTERRRAEKKKGIKIGTPEWFKHWFDLPYLREDITRDELMSRLKDQQRGRYINAMLDAMHKLVQSKGAKHSLGSYAFEIGKVFGFDSRELEKMYRNEYMSEDVTQPQLNALEKAVDKVFGQVGIDVEFTRHFLDRANDARNGQPISIKELAMLFKKEYQRWGKPIAQMGPNAQAVLKDLESDINVPFVLQWDRENNELDMIAKTVMRKKDFRTSNKEFPVEALTNNVMQRAQQQLSEKSKIDPKLIEKIIAKALELGIDPNVLLAIAYKESRIRTGLTGDKNKKDFAHGIFQVRKPAMQDVNRYYKTNYSVDDMKNDVDANIDAGARYYKMMYDAYGAEDLESALAGYNGGPKAARTGKNKQANKYASSVNNISKDIQSVITVPQPKKVTPSKNEPYRDDSTDPESWDEPEYPMVDPDAVDSAVKQAIAYEPPKTATKQPEIITTVLPPAPTEPSLAPATSPRPKLRPTKTTYQDLATANNISNPDFIKVGQKINMPDGTTHTVRSGDTLSGIAKKHNRRSLESKVEEVFDIALENFADGKINEAFDNPYPITWEYLKPTGASSAIGKVEDGSALDIHISEDPDGIYEIEFARGQSQKNMGRTGQGDEFRIFATVQTAMIEWWEQLDKTKARKITFYANKEDGNRARLYKRFLKIWGDKSEWDIEVNGNVKPGLVAYSLTNPNPDKPKNDKKTFMQRVFGKKETVENFADGKINEVLDKPAAYTWSKDQFGFPTATAKELGLNIHFDGRNEPSWEVSFNRKQKDGSVVMNQPTGQGKEFQVFATVKAAILDFMNKYPDTVTLMLDARKDGGNDGEGRVSLYRRMMKQYANKLGWEYDEFDQGVMVTFEISSNPRTDENFADGKKKGKSRPGRVKRAGASCNGSVTELRKKAKNSSGERAKMYHWCANMKSGRKKSK